VIANRTNEIMKVLTIFSAIMLPLTLIAGIYGMNFALLPELHWKYGYWYALGLMGITAAVMLIWFRRRGWIGRSGPPPPHTRL
jgi:magnesium transporter